MRSKIESVEDVLYDEYSQIILKSTLRFKSVSQISKTCKIPLSTTYRRVNILKKLEFLDVTGYLIDGIKYRKYKRNSKLRHAEQNPKIRYMEGNPKIDRILDAISNNPGINFTELRKLSGCANGTLSYCISNLLTYSQIKVKRTKRRTCFFLPDTDSNEIDLIINLRKETTKRILVYILENGQATFSQIKSAIHKSPGTTSLALTHLVDLGLVKRIPDFSPKFELINKIQVIHALEKINPTTVDNLKDKFADTFSYL